MWYLGSLVLIGLVVCDFVIGLVVCVIGLVVFVVWVVVGLLLGLIVSVVVIVCIYGFLVLVSDVVNFLLCEFLGWLLVDWWVLWA